MTATGPAVRGVVSPAGHVNHPDARYCYRTGLRIDPSAPRTTGPRPAVGVLTLDDGSSHALVTDLVIGRDPRGHRFVADGRARALILDDASGLLSRVHLLIILRGWAICVADLGSRNGTVLMDRDADRSLPPGESVDVGPSAELRCGGRTLRLDHLHVR